MEGGFAPLSEEPSPDEDAAWGCSVPCRALSLAGLPREGKAGASRGSALVSRSKTDQGPTFIPSVLAQGLQVLTVTPPLAPKCPQRVRGALERFCQTTQDYVAC